MKGEKIELLFCRLRRGPATVAAVSVTAVGGEIGQRGGVARAEVTEHQRVTALGELDRRRERLAVKLLSRHAKGLEAAVDGPVMGEGARAKKGIERAVHVGDVRGFLLQVGPSIQKYSGALAVLGNGEVMPIVIKHDFFVAASLSPLPSWAIGDRGAGREVHPLVRMYPQHPPVWPLDGGDPRPGPPAAQTLPPPAESHPTYPG